MIRQGVRICRYAVRIIPKRCPDVTEICMQLNKERINLSACNAQAEGKPSKMLEVVLKEKRRETIKEWLDSGRIKDINSEI